MTADEIRNLVANCDKEVKGAAPELQSRLAMVAVSSMALTMAAEIAAQLAEANEARKPKWVWLEWVGQPFCVLASDVQYVSAGHAKVYIVIRGADEPISVSGTLAEVCAKLGIPMPEGK